VSNESALEAVPSLGTVVPNPSAARASVSVTLQEAGHATVAVYDLLGRQVATVLDRALSAGTATLDLEVGALPAGTYMVRLAAGGATVVRPFTVAR
ncbi:T9SS type A sorting domain-containing protein, partial [Rubrivirga sp.]|uniref:T9SS type A sorting domain-containing protein n=1 Tax=Rubrivirga sp. TaxID=1885344 RepID=UPI003C789B05